MGWSGSHCVCTVHLFCLDDLLDTIVILCRCLVGCCVAEVVPHFTVLNFLLDADYFFIQVIFFFSQKETISIKKNTGPFFFLRRVLFFAQMPQTAAVVKKVLWAIP